MRKILIVFVSILVSLISVFAQKEIKPCPAMKVASPVSLTSPGETITFSAKVENENLDLKYEWTVSSGTIVEGQYTSTIKVVTTPEMGDSIVTAKVIVQNLPANCLNETFGKAAIARKIACGLTDDYGQVSSATEKSMLDNLFMQLVNNPETIAFFRLEREKNESVNQIKSRIKRIMRHADFRKFDKKRFVFAIDKSETNSFGYLTSADLIFKNTELPECENCEIIKGEDVK